MSEHRSRSAGVSFVLAALNVAVLTAWAPAALAAPGQVAADAVASEPSRSSVV
jgi:hypothetical protein